MQRCDQITRLTGTWQCYITRNTESRPCSDLALMHHAEGAAPQRKINFNICIFSLCFHSYAAGDCIWISEERYPYRDIKCAYSIQTHTCTNASHNLLQAIVHLWSSSSSRGGLNKSGRWDTTNRLELPPLWTLKGQRSLFLWRRLVFILANLPRIVHAGLFSQVISEAVRPFIWTTVNFASREHNTLHVLTHPAQRTTNPGPQISPAKSTSFNQAGSISISGLPKWCGCHRTSAMGLRITSADPAAVMWSRTLWCVWFLCVPHETH